MKYVLILILSVYCCASQPYFNNTDFIFTVQSSLIERQDSIKLESSNQFLAKQKILWEFRIDNGKVIINENKTCIQNSDRVFLKNPTSEYLRNTVYIPHPQVKLPLAIGDSIYVEQKELVNNEAHDSVSIRGYLKVVDKIKYGENTKDNDVWKIEAINIDNPKYRATYYYSEKSGFVYFKYIFDDEVVEMNFRVFVYTMR